MYQQNPLKVQTVPSAQRRRNIPLVLIHDGGGTTFGYFILGNLHREVWAIHNPNYHTAEEWEGGMDEMARHYIDLLIKAGIKGTIYLGGWSLGGYLSVTIARMLAESSSYVIKIAGLVLMDSPFHEAWSRLDTASMPDADFGNVPDLVLKSLNNCTGLLTNWDLPDWDGPACEGRDIVTTVSGRDYCVPAGHIMYKPLKADWEVQQTVGFEHSKPSQDSEDLRTHLAPPPAIMIRCVRRAPTRDIWNPNPCRIDLRRSETVLGWDGNYPDFIKAVIDIDSDHFAMFNFSKIEALTTTLNESLEVLDTMEIDENFSDY